jgi:catechol 2,3-dioxygenase-like lactoylglutathione lyase family enzyme
MILPCLISALCIATPPDLEAAVQWRYVTPPAGDSFEHAPLRALGLVSERPEDLVVKVDFRGTRQRYAQIRYGSPSSVRVTVVLDEIARGVAEVYVDSDRNRRIEARDRVEGENRTWRTRIDLAIVEGETTRYEPREALFRLGATGITFSFATVGFLEGRVEYAGHAHAARRVDADGNGLVADAQDRIWIDLDNDGNWDAASEQFLFSSILPLAGARYSVRADPYGQRLALEPLLGSGTVRLALARQPGQPAPVELAATLIGRDGSALGLTSDAAQATVPIGEYRLGTVTCAFEDPAGGPRWSFVFSDIERRGEAVWYKVEKDGDVLIDAIGALKFETGAEGIGAQRPGNDMRVQPRLYSGDGLLIVTCYRGSPTSPSSDSGPGAQIALETTEGRTLATAHSGFA